MELKRHNHPGNCFKEKKMQQLLKLPHFTSFTGPIHHYLSKDPRHYQILFQLLFLIYGITVLDWDKDILKYLCIFLSCILTQWLFNQAEKKNTIKSALISALSLCLMLKTNTIAAAVVASALSIGSKYIFRINGKHIFNPTNFGIILTILLTKEAWITPGQWGSNGMLLFFIGSLGFSVLLTVKRLDIALTFLITFCGLNFLRQVIYLGWETDFFFHTFTSGTLLLFTFFMITDPVSSPSSKTARVIWALLTGVLAYWLQTKFFVTGAPVWALFFLSLLTPVLDSIFKGERFQWIK
jgi:Na+-transporting NADH:ubiquinone oxidoreductase subunit NqrB